MGRRTTRYKRTDEQIPRYLALHEYDEAPMGTAAQQLKLVVGSEWSKKQISNAKTFDRDIWEYISEYGKGPAGEKL